MEGTCLSISEYPALYELFADILVYGTYVLLSACLVSILLFAWAHHTELNLLKTISGYCFLVSVMIQAILCVGWATLSIHIECWV